MTTALSPSDVGGIAPLVLIAEDDRDTRDMYREFLRGSGFAIEHAPDGLKALELTVELRPDVVVTDLALPGLDGFQLCDHVRHNEQTQHIPVIAVTGYSFDGLDERARLVGIDRVLVKPCLPESLVAEIRSVLGKIDDVPGQTLKAGRQLVERHRRAGTGHPGEPEPAVTVEARPEHLINRLRRQFDEMPGLSLTLAQATRLLGVESRTCEQALTRLVDSGFLGRTPPGIYRKRCRSLD